LLLSLVKTPVGLILGAFLGTVALLLTALIVIRLMPNGISAYLQRFTERRVGA
jgi:branched-chain amino acid transport system permease protein